MPKKKQSLTVAELKSLLIARFNAHEDGQAKLQTRLQQELGKEIREGKPEITAIKNKFEDWISGILARRLKQNRRTTPLLSPRDLVRFVPSVIDEIEKAEGYKMEAEERKMFEKFMKAMFDNIFEMLHLMVPPRKNLYEEYWRWVNTVLNLADERGTSPIELFGLEGATDEITRRMFTKKQFVTLSKRSVNKFINADMIRKMIVQPMLDMIAAEVDEEERREIEQELETELMPKLRETVKKIKGVINTFFNEEVDRIYTTV